MVSNWSFNRSQFYDTAHRNVGGFILRKTIARCNSRIQIITIEQSSEIVDMLFLTKLRKLQRKNLQLFAISDSTLYITVLFLRRRIMDETAGEGAFRDRTKKFRPLL